MLKEDKEIKPPFSKLHLVKEECEITWLTGHSNRFKMPDRTPIAHEIRQWIDDNCSHPVAFNTSNDNEGCLFFYSKEDLMIFKLVWAGEV